MPSDPRVESALAALTGSIERYRSALVSAVEEVRGYLASHLAAETPDETTAAELGQFGADRIDLERFAGFVASDAELDPVAVERVEEALAVLREIAARGDEAFCIDVERGGSLGEAVSGALTEAGRVFAAARLVAAAKVGTLPASENGRGESLSFGQWKDGERRLAPPLVVQVDGADLRAGELAGFLDGAVKIVLVVRGDCAPAPLVRLITPGTLVIQTIDASDLDRVVEADGPAVAALVPESAARFIHDPGAGRAPWDRLELVHVPEETPARPIGGLSVRQQMEELEQLTSLAEGRAAAAPSAEPGSADARDEASPAAAEPADPVDRLAAWLLSQADLNEFG